VLGVAGGDGTVSTVAAVTAVADRALVVVPAGTRNHFARDLGLDVHDPAATLRALRDGERAQVNLGLVAGRPFVYYGDDLVDYVAREFHVPPLHPSPVVGRRRIPFWSDLAEGVEPGEL
jgi:hypothetical protein